MKEFVAKNSRLLNWTGLIPVCTILWFLRFFDIEQTTIVPLQLITLSVQIFAIYLLFKFNAFKLPWRD